MGATRRNRGAITILAGFILMAAVGLAVVAIDLGHLSTVSGEVQTLADSAAAAAARSLMQQKSDPGAVAATMLATNTVDGAAGSKTSKSQLEIGTFDYATAKYTKGGAAPNAARVTVTATVANIVAGVYGDAESVVTREAIAAFSGTATGHPTLPLAIGRCHFTQYQSNGSCGSLPKLTQAPDGKDGSGWSSLGPDNASANKAVRYLPADCGGGGEAAARMRIGDSIGIMNGQANSVLKTVEDCVAAGHNDFVVPIVDVDCKGKFNKQQPVVGFATIHVTTVKAKGGSKGIDVSAICSTKAPGEVPGGPDYGTRAGSIVR